MFKKFYATIFSIIMMFSLYAQTFAVNFVDVADNFWQ